MNSILRALALVILTFCFGASAAPKTTADTLTVDKAFLRLPDDCLTILPVETRSDMLDYLRADTLMQVRNLFSGESWIEKASPDYLKIHLTDVSDLEIKILPTPGGLPLAMTVYTIGTDAQGADSTVKFYDNAMQPIPENKVLKLPNPKQYWNLDQKGAIPYRQIEGMVPFYTVKYSASPQTTELRAEVTIDAYLSREHMEKMKPWLRNALTYQWTGKKMKLID